VSAGIKYPDSDPQFAASDSTVFALTSGSISRSTDNGTRWVACTSGVSGYVTHLAANKTTILAATYPDGFFLSTNNGTRWTNVNAGLPPTTSVSSLVVSGGYLVMGTPANGGWRCPIAEMARIVDNPGMKRPPSPNFRIRLPGAYASSAIIDFSVPRSEKVIITVYNLAGHAIATLINQDCASGDHSITWNTRTVAVGRYVLRMQIGAHGYIKSVSIVR
jgi:hypothetical protein